MSGACALVYQVAWTRDLRLVFGASTPASAAVVAIFVGGLGLGAWKLGARVEKSNAPLRFYAALELGIAACSAVTPFLATLATRAYVALGGTCWGWVERRSCACSWPRWCSERRRS